LSEDRYNKITDAIQKNTSVYALLKDRGGKFEDIDIEEYIGNFEDIGYLVKDKTWCNTDVQRVVQDARKADKSITATSNPIYGQLEKLAKSYLLKERQSCKDLDNQ